MEFATRQQTPIRKNCICYSAANADQEKLPLLPGSKGNFFYAFAAARQISVSDYLWNASNADETDFRRFLSV
jgi:hypothetical protein